MKVLGILFLSLAPVLLGLDYRNILKKRKDFFCIFKEYVIFVKEQIRFCGRERNEIFALALNDPRFNSPIFKKIENSIKYGENLTKILDECIDIRLKNAEIYEINSFVSGLGKSDTEGQLSHCDYYISVFDEIAKKTGDTYSAKSKLSLGLSLSLAAVMFIIMV